MFFGSMYLIGLAPARGAHSLPTVGRTQSDSDKMQGVWRPEKWILQGKQTAKSAVASITLTIKGNTYDVLVGSSHDLGTFTLSQKSRPKSMDLTGSEGPNRGKSIPAIYQVDRSHLTVCYGLDGTRPSAFTSPVHKLVLLVVYAHPKQ